MRFFQTISKSVYDLTRRDTAAGPSTGEMKSVADRYRRDSLLQTSRTAPQEEEALTYQHEVRVALIRRAISSRNDLLLLPSDEELGSSACVFMFLPRNLLLAANNEPLGGADIEKLNRINTSLPSAIRGACAQYVQAMRIHQPSHRLFANAHGSAIAALRIANGHPHFSMPLVETLLTTACTRGWAALALAGYRIPPRTARPHHREQLLRVADNLVRGFFGGRRYAALVYGSLAEPANVLLADLNLMVFVDELPAVSGEAEEKVETQAAPFTVKFRELMAGLNVRTVSDVPFERSLVVPLQTTQRLNVYDGIAKDPCRVVSPVAEEKYMASEEMLQRLVLAVLTTPHVCISGELAMLDAAKFEAERTLVRKIFLLNPQLCQKVDAAVIEHGTSFDAEPFVEEFVQTALGDAERSGAEYLGYFDRKEVKSHLADIWRKYSGEKLRLQEDIISG